MISSVEKAVLRWERGAAPISPYQLAEATENRVYIDEGNRLIFTSVLISDSDHYRSR